MKPSRPLILMERLEARENKSICIGLCFFLGISWGHEDEEVPPFGGGGGGGW